MKQISAVLVLGSLIGATPASTAKDISDLTVDQQIEIVRSLNEAARQATIAANVEMSSEVGEAFWPVYRSYRGEVSTLNDRLKAVILQYAEGYGSLTGEVAYELSETVLKVQVQRDKLKQKYLRRFAKALPQLDAARVIQLENKLDALSLAELAFEVPLIQAE